MPCGPGRGKWRRCSTRRVAIIGYENLGKLPSLDESKVSALLAENGNLVKRAFPVGARPWRSLALTRRPGQRAVEKMIRRPTLSW